MCNSAKSLHTNQANLTCPKCICLRAYVRVRVEIAGIFNFALNWRGNIMGRVRRVDGWGEGEKFSAARSETKRCVTGECEGRLPSLTLLACNKWAPLIAFPPKPSIGREASSAEEPLSRTETRASSREAESPTQASTDTAAIISRRMIRVGVGLCRTALSLFLKNDNHLN